jgi:nicotinate-nucleotide adenylyltransferase
VHVSLLALRRLDLDEVWWLVSPQNPLKPIEGMTPFAARLEQACGVAAAHRRLRVSDLEGRLRSSGYTVDTLKALRRRFPRHRFVWLMGSDNLCQIPRWEQWPEIFRMVTVAVFDRPSYSLKALSGVAAQRFARRRIPVAAARRLAETSPPAWVFFHTPLDTRSATQIRSEQPIALPQASKEERSELSTIATLRPRPGPMRLGSTAAEILELVRGALEDGRAEDVVTVDLAGKTTFADYMLIASGRSTRQVLALTERLENALSRRIRISTEGKAQGDWVLIDAGDVIVHLFRPEIRAYYNLEKMWGEALPESDAVHL